MNLRLSQTAFAVATLMASSAYSQTLTGRVTRGSVPVVGALVLVVDAGGRIVAGSASRDQGE